MAIALIFAAGYPAGLLARRVGMPAVTGNILAGVLLGPSLFGVFPSTMAEDLELVTIFAMGLITVVIGGHLNYRRLHNAKRRIGSVALLEITLTAGLVTSAVFLVGQEWPTAILLGGHRNGHRSGNRAGRRARGTGQRVAREDASGFGRAG